MRLLIAHVLTPLFHICFVGVLLIFHPIQWVTYHLLGEMPHRRLVYFMNGCLSASLYVLGNSVRFINEQKLPTDRPLIIVANHNSLHDIPTIYNRMRRYHPVFVSKKSLSKGLPSVSFNLRKSGAALIDRGDRMQALKEILKLGSLINDRKFSAVIFPEGTRKGKNLKPFKAGGVSALLKKAPNALIVPIAISGTYQLNKFGKYPMNVFQRLKWTVLQPIEPKGLKVEDVMNQAREAIAKELDLD